MGCIRVNRADRERGGPRRVGWLILSCSLVALECRAQPPDFQNDFRLRFGAGHSDNILRTSAGAVSGEYRALGFLFSANRDGERVETRFNGDIEYRDYSLPTIDNEPVGSITALVAIDVVPERFQWFFEDSYGQARIDQFVPVGPANRQDTNVFATGPRVILPVGSRTTLRIDGEHQRRRFQNTPLLDNDSDEVNIGLFRALSSTADIGLTLGRREITADAVAAAWEDDTVFITYQRSLASGSATLRLGENTVRVGGVEISGPLFDVGWDRDVGARSRLNITATRDFVDPGDRFRYTNAVVAGGIVGTLLPSDVLLGAGVYELKSFAVGNSTTLERTRFSFGAGAGESDYRASPAFNNKSRSFNAAVDHEVSARLGLGLRTNLYKIELLQLGRDDTDRWTQVYLRRGVGRRAQFQFSYIRNTRDSQGSALLSYDENIYQIALVLDLNP
jgi:hypothetical protein